MEWMIFFETKIGIEQLSENLIIQLHQKIINLDYIQFLSMNDNIETDAKPSFKKGMTLSQYMQEMKPEDSQMTKDQIQEQGQDLYETCLVQYHRSPSTKLIPFNIPEMDEDNYESSVDFAPQTPMFDFHHQSQLLKQQQQTLKQQQQQPVIFREKSLKKNFIQTTTLYNPKSKQKTEPRFDKQPNKDYRIKQFSNSPFKREYQITPTKNNLSKTLYGNTFLSNPLSNMSTASSTLYQNKLTKIGEKSSPGEKLFQGKTTIHSRESKNQKYFHQKNKRDIDNMIQYENNIRMKYNNKINVLDIRVDGFKDKIYERKNRILH